MSMNAPQKLEIVFRSADNKQSIDADWVEKVAYELRRISNVGAEPVINIGEAEATMIFGENVMDISSTQGTNSRIIPTVGRFFRDKPNDYDLPQPDYDVFTDTLTCNITIK